MGKETHQITCAIVDDEPLAVEILEDYVQKVPYLNYQASFSDGMETLNFLREQKVDLLFLDIQMPNVTGLQLMEVLDEPPMIIFTTAYENYALKSYEYDAVDYLLKPVEFERFLKAVEKAWKRKRFFSHEPVSMENTTAEPQSYHGSQYLFVKTEYRMQKILVDDILYIEGMKNYLRIVTRHEKIMTLSSFKKMESVLPVRNFQRIHKSFIVAIDKIDNIERHRVKIRDKLLPVSDSYKESFYRKIDNMSIG